MMRSAKKTIGSHWIYDISIHPLSIPVGCWYEVTYASNDGYHWVSIIKIIDKRFLLAKEAPSDAQSLEIVASV